jgi:tRNA pseudouridine55 synthase
MNPSSGAPEGSPPRAPGPCGVLVIDKPRGPTSHDVVATVRRKLRERRVGHAGTLDPMATGVLVVLVGEATKLEPFVGAQTKSYDARVSFGLATDTLDAEGRETTRAPLPEALIAAVSRNETAWLEAALEVERRRTSQVPPAHSAVHVDGVRSYARARAGEVVELPPRPVSVAQLVVNAVGLDGELAYADVALVVSKGYYVRSLARDLGASVGLPAHLSALRRSASGPFTLAAATSLDAPPEVLRAALIDLTQAASFALPRATLTEAGAARGRQGKRLTRDDFTQAPPNEGPCAWLSEQGALVAIGEADGDEHVVRRGFVSAAPCPAPP